jgi:hypothetical protein
MPKSWLEDGKTFPLMSSSSWRLGTSRMPTVTSTLPAQKTTIGALRLFPWCANGASLEVWCWIVNMSPFPIRRSSPFYNISLGGSERRSLHFHAFFQDFSRRHAYQVLRSKWRAQKYRGSKISKIIWVRSLNLGCVFKTYSIWKNRFKELPWLVNDKIKIAQRL